MNTPPTHPAHAPGRLLLVPVSLSEQDWPGFLPAQAWQEVSHIRHFVVETPKAARAQLKRLAHPGPIAELDIQALPAEAGQDALDALLRPALAGHDIGLMSDAGCPAVADPGARLVARAHEAGIRVTPLVGPSSILLALMGSGLNGQSFAFNGYLPVQDGARDTALRTLEDESRRLSRTQIFIETPYRNERLFAALLKVCRPDTRLCVARNLTGSGEFILTRSIAQWRKHTPPELARQPALFLLLGADR
ncbi:MAG: SAM-dependent methyltransferase [Rhodocyclaceae bacterium]